MIGEFNIGIERNAEPRAVVMRDLRGLEDLVMLQFELGCSPAPPHRSHIDGVSTGRYGLSDHFH